jgi:hypothetical protein
LQYVPPRTSCEPTTYQLETPTTTGLDDIGDHSLESGKESAEQSQDKSPGCEIIVSVGAVTHRRELEIDGNAKVRLYDTHANPTPAMTGSKLMSFIALNLPRKNNTEIRMVNNGVDARTT